jgi:hypothetical protein
MKVDIKSVWSSARRCPNVYLLFECENETEKALLRALYFVRPSFTPNSDGRPMLDFYPRDPKKGK